MRQQPHSDLREEIELGCVAGVPDEGKIDQQRDPTHWDVAKDSWIARRSLHHGGEVRKHRPIALRMRTRDDVLYGLDWMAAKQAVFQELQGWLRLDLCSIRDGGVDPAVSVAGESFSFAQHVRAAEGRRRVGRSARWRPRALGS